MGINFNNPVSTEPEANLLIRTKLQRREPFFAARLGSVELDVSTSFLFDGKWSEQVRNWASNNAGINPPDDINLMNFAIHYLDSIRDVDIMAVWDLNHYDTVVNLFCPKAELIPLTGLEPYYFPENPWSELLEGRRVLVIHPFEESIKKQFAKRNDLFKGTKVLPSFELVTIKAEQTMGNTNASYFDSLETMKNKIYRTEFDFAIIGCGGYGLPLGSFIKEAKKRSSIQLGGATQILFGIMGNRWLENERIMKFHNESWTRPLISETPPNSKAVENACYW